MPAFELNVMTFPWYSIYLASVLVRRWLGTHLRLLATHHDAAPGTEDRLPGVCELHLRVALAHFPVGAGAASAARGVAERRDDAGV